MRIERAPDMIRRAILRHVGIPIALLLGLVVLARAGQDNGGGSTTSAQPSGTVSQVSAGNCITLTPTTITTTGSVALTTPASIGCGGTNATSMSTTDGVVYYDGTRLVTTAVGSATQVLTSNGAGVAPTFQAAGGGGVTFPLLAPNGSLSAPSYSFTNGSDSGLFSPSGAHDVTLTSGSPGSTSTGAVTTIQGGPGGSSSGTGGDVTLAGGIPISGAGGNININAASAVGASAFSGGAVTINAGNSTSTAFGAAVTITAGHGGSGSSAQGGAATLKGGNGGSAGGNSTGGNAVVQGGSSGTSGGNGGNVQITGGPATSGSGGNGGNVVIIGGTPGLGAGGPVTLQGATGVGVNKSGGAVTIQAGSASGSGSLGNNGSLQILGGTVNAGGTAQNIVITGGAGAGTSTGDAVNITAGTGGSTATGGSITLTSGAGGSSSGNSGNINLTPGAVTSGTPGHVLIGAFCTASGAMPQTCNGLRGIVTTGTLTTAAATDASFVINDSSVTASSLIQVTDQGYSGTLVTNGYPALMTAVPGSGTITVHITNTHPSNALNGTVQIGFVVLN